MKKAVLTGVGGPEKLEIVETESPVPGKDEVLIRVKHAGVAFADVIMRRGKYLGAPKFPLTPGYDVCGEITKLGPGVEGLQVGDTVLAFTQFGGYAEEVATKTVRVFKAPADINSAEGASLVLNYITAHQILTGYAALKSGQTILVYSAAGGVGTAALQLARVMGLKAYGACSSGKTEIVREYGAIPIDYKSEDVASRLRELEPNGVDMVLDPIGGEHLEESRALVKTGGFLICFGFFSAFSGDALTGGLGSTIRRMLALRFLQRRVKARFYSVNPNNRAKNEASMRELLALYEARKIKPLIGADLPLTEVREAHRLLTSGGSRGKIVLNCS